MFEGQERKVNHEFLKGHFFREGRLKESQALYILEEATNIFSREPNMVPLRSPVTSLSFTLSSVDRVVTEPC
jgi:serine/threonine-protein phosphatase 2B catalytic subunit